MVKLVPVQKIEDIENQNQGYFVLVGVTKRDRNKQATHGRLLDRGKHRDPVMKKLNRHPEHQGPFYFGYAGKPQHEEFCYFHMVSD